VRTPVDYLGAAKQEAVKARLYGSFLRGKVLAGNLEEEEVAQEPIPSTSTSVSTSVEPESASQSTTRKKRRRTVVDQAGGSREETKEERKQRRAAKKIAKSSATGISPPEIRTHVALVPVETSMHQRPKKKRRLPEQV